jgi:hypothetical protein
MNSATSSKMVVIWGEISKSMWVLLRRRCHDRRVDDSAERP